MTPSPITILAKIYFCSVLEWIPGTGMDFKIGYLSSDSDSCKKQNHNISSADLTYAGHPYYELRT